MSTSDKPDREHPSTYFVQDRSNLDEMTRLRIQDQMITASMGGVLPEQADPSHFERVLDVGCGTGGWLIETAKRYPTIKQLVGVDISNKMLDFARNEAEKQGVSDRVTFHTMDALRMLEFPENSFDLVNHRLALSWLRTWDWPKLLQEYRRVCQPGGIVRVTETDQPESTSSALSRLGTLLLEAFYQGGYFFRLEPDGVTSELTKLLALHGLQNGERRDHTIEYQGGTEMGQLFFEDMKQIFRNLLPFLRKWTHLPDDYEEIYQQMLTDIQQPEFRASWRFVTVWGTKQLE